MLIAPAFVTAGDTAGNGEQFGADLDSGAAGGVEVNAKTDSLSLGYEFNHST